MSTETMQHLNTQTLIGYTDKRGHAWHYRAEDQGDESNHYPGAIPVEDVTRRLFHWTPAEGPVETTILTQDGVSRVTDPSRKVIVRPDTGTVLGVFKSGYRVHDYTEWLLRNVETILDADLAVGSAGLLKGGAQAWVQIEMEDTITGPGDVEFRPFLTACTSMDGSIATGYRLGAQVVVCDNTLRVALDEKVLHSLKIRHTKGSLSRIGEARAALGIVHSAGDAFNAQVQALLDERVDDARFDRFVDVVTGRKDESLSKVAATKAETKAEALLNLWRNDLRAAPWQGTAYGVLAAMNTYVHHVQPVRGADRATRNAERVVTGKVDDLDLSTLKHLALV